MNRKTTLVLSAALLGLGTTGFAWAQATPGYKSTEKIQEEYQTGGGSYTGPQTEKIQQEYQAGGGSANKASTAKLDAGNKSR